MGDTGSRRSTLVSRLPIFRRSSAKRQGSLPSSPSSATNGAHTSSPSSTNSSSSSAGKRRGIFRAASIGFHGKKSHEPRAEARNSAPHLSNGLPLPEQPQPGAEKSDEGVKSKARHPFGFPGSSRGKKITRSVTEDFVKGKDPSANRNVFINCISAGRSSFDEADDSGFPDDDSKKLSSAKHSGRKLLPKSFSTHAKLSKQAARSQSATAVDRPVVSPRAHEAESEPGIEARPPACLSRENTAENSLLSNDHTTAQTPSEFTPISADSISEADKESPGTLECQPASPAPIPAGPFRPAAGSGPSPSPRVERAPRKETEAAVETPDRHGEKGAESGRAPPPELGTASPNAGERRAGQRPETKEASSGEARQRPPDLVAAISPVAHGVPSVRNGLDVLDLSAAEAYKLPIAKPVSVAKPQEQSHGTSQSTVTVNRTFSPHHEERWVERRLRSSSEGTSGSRMSHSMRDGRVEELNSLRKPRTDSSSSKMNSMDVLNRLGSCDLDEDDLMLDLEFPDQGDNAVKRFVGREDSNQSIKSCIEILHSPVERKMKIEGPKVPDAPKEPPSTQSSKEGEAPESRAPRNTCWSSVPSLDWSLLRDEENGALEAMSLRLMMQDCTAVKTMLLKLKRILQEDLRDESSLLKLQLKEKDQLISQLREELEQKQQSKKAISSRADKCTQTEISSHDFAVICFHHMSSRARNKEANIWHLSESHYAWGLLSHSCNPIQEFGIVFQKLKATVGATQRLRVFDINDIGQATEVNNMMSTDSI
uniref:Coiled-coil serine rich protein 1 n=1 Tax=Callorhinchus milii TaxID=7868 RepID=A0A4W3I5K6_CALMI